MMKANELRIGNFIRHFCARDKSNYIVVSSIHMSPDCTEINKDEQGSYYNIDDMEGIPITEEWLLKFGFEKTGYSRWTLNGFVRLSCDFIYANGKVILSRGEYPSELIIENIEFVHQLQNLYYALCGEELPIKHAPA